MSARLTEQFFLYQQAWADAGIIIQAEEEVPEDRLPGFSLAVCRFVKWPPKKSIWRHEDEAGLWDLIRHFRATGAQTNDGRPWDLEVNIRKNFSEGNPVDEFGGIRFRIVYINQSC